MEVEKLVSVISPERSESWPVRVRIYLHQHVYDCVRLRICGRRLDFIANIVDVFWILV